MSSGLVDTATEFPYPGLRPFEPHEANIFFGRKQHITDLLKRLNAHRFLGVVGPSGCGKSSLIRAGLIPALHGGFMSRSKYQWSSAILRPGNQPLLRLATALSDSGIFGDPQSKGGLDAQQLRDDLEAGSRSLANRLILNQAAQNTNLLIVVDQFEELFRFEQEGGGDESRAFVNLLLETARDCAASAYVVLTMRTDFLGQCPVFAGLPEALNDSQYLTPRLTREQIELAIVGPARLFSGEVDEDVLARILNEMGTDPDQLPLMQHLLMRMWRRATRREGTTKQTASIYVPNESYIDNDAVLDQAAIRLTMEDYLVTGGLAKALGNHAETVFSERLTTDSKREIAEQLFRQLTSVAPNGELVRRSPAPEFSALTSKLGIQSNELGEIIDEFRAEGRSFVMPPPGEELKENTPIDISHESLIRNWLRLQEWTKDEARTAEVRTEISKDAARWKAGGRQPDDTWVPESRLVAALAWSESHPKDVATDVRDFLVACVRRRDEARLKDRELVDARRKKTVAITIATVLLALAAIAIWQRIELAKQKNATDSVLAHQYWRTAAQQLQSSSNTAPADDLAAGLMWLVEAYCKEPRPIGDKEELYKTRFGAAFAQHPKLRQLWHHRGLTTATMACSKDGKYVLTAANDNGKCDLRIWDATQGYEAKEAKPIHTIVVEHEVNATEFHGAGNNLHILAAMGKKGSAQGTLSVWRWPERERPPQLVNNKPLMSSFPILNAAFLAASNGSTSPSVVAIVEEQNSLTSVKLWRSVDDSPLNLNVVDLEDAQAGADEAPVTMLTVSRDGRFVAAWGASDKGQRNAFHIWNVNSRAMVGSNSYDGSAVVRAEFNSSGTEIATVDDQGEAGLWSTSTGQRLFQWLAHDGAASYVNFSPDDRQLITTGEDKVAKLWQISNAKSPEEGERSPAKVLQDSVPMNFKFPHESTVTFARFSPDGRFVATGGRDRIVRIWDTSTGRAIAPTLHHAFSLFAVEFSPDGNRLLTQILDTVQVWQLSTDNAPPRPLRSGDRLINTAYSANGKYAVVFGSTSNRIEGRIWDVAIGHCSHTQPLVINGAQTLSYVGVSNDGRHTLTVTQETAGTNLQQEILLWDVTRQRSMQLKADGLGIVRSAAFSTDQQLVLTASEPQLKLAKADQPGSSMPSSDSEQRGPSWQLQVWSMKTGDPLLAIPVAHVGPVNHIVWSERGSDVVISTGNSKDSNEKNGGAGLWQWNDADRLFVKKQQWQHKPRVKSTNAVLYAAFSPDGELVVTGGADDTAYLWSASKAVPLSPRLKHTSDIVHVAFSMDGKQFATSSIADKKTCVWNVDQIERFDINDAYFEAKLTFEHSSRVNRAVFSKNGNWLATVSEDGTARIWSLEHDGDSAAVFTHDGNVQSAWFDSDEDRLLTFTENRWQGTGFNNPSGSWPQRWEWRLKSSQDAGLPLEDPDKLRDCVRLLAASELDSQRAIMRPISPALSTSRSAESDRTGEIARLWQLCGGILSRGGVVPPSHLELADASEARGQSFAAAWHLEQELTNAPSPRNAAYEQKLQFSELYSRWARAIMRQDQWDQDQWNQVVHLLSKAIEYDPDQWRLWFERASVYEQSNRPEMLQSALFDYTKAISLATPPDRLLSSSRARLNSQLGRTADSISDWTEAIQGASENEQLTYRAHRAEEFAKLKEWPQAAADFAAQFNAAPNTKSGYALILTQLKVGDQEGYLDTCNKLLHLVASSSYADDASFIDDAGTVAWLCTLAPHPLLNYEPILVIAERVVRQCEQNQPENQHLYLRTLAALHFRAGNWNKALDLLVQSRQAQVRQMIQTQKRDSRTDIRQSKANVAQQPVEVGNQDFIIDNVGSVWDWLLLAMTYKKLGDATSAEKWLTRARENFEFDSATVWDTQAELEILFAEASQLIEGAL